MTFIFKDDKTGLTDIIRNHHHHQHENEPVIKAGKEKTKCLLNIAGKASVKASVQVQEPRTIDTGW